MAQNSLNGAFPHLYNSIRHTIFVLFVSSGIAYFYNMSMLPASISLLFHAIDMSLCRYHSIRIVCIIASGYFMCMPICCSNYSFMIMLWKFLDRKQSCTVEELASHRHNGTASSTSLTGKAWARGPEYATHGSEGILGVYSITNDWYGQGHAEGRGNSAGFTIDASHSHTVDVTSSGGNASHENRQPFTIVNMWQRTV